MKLRNWQSECISRALVKFEKIHSHFLCLATPGAGKTTMASVLAKRLFVEDKIDLVMCFSPSTIITEDFRDELEQQTSRSFHGGFGASGKSFTYQSMANLDTDFWSLFSRNRVFVIFDEIHHCAGLYMSQSNVWGQHIIANIQGKAAYTLALTGTPWRSDSIPISLAKYCEESQEITCDYQYGLTNAIADIVCRTPHITVIDNECIKVHNPAEQNTYSSIKAFIAEGKYSYKELIEHPAFISFMLKHTNSKLNKIRLRNPNAAGLIVAASVEHAYTIKKILNSLGEKSDIATYKEDGAITTIQNFKASESKWIISVGMISEGTNIPRLQICCYLSQVKTELYFRQVLGRVLRANNLTKERGYLIVPAQPKLLEYSQRVSDDIPQQNIVEFEKGIALDIKPESSVDGSSTVDISKRKKAQTVHIDFQITDIEAGQYSSKIEETYDTAINSFGRFKTEIYAL